MQMRKENPSPQPLQKVKYSLSLNIFCERSCNSSAKSDVVCILHVLIFLNMVLCVVLQVLFAIVIEHEVVVAQFQLKHSKTCLQLDNTFFY